MRATGSARQPALLSSFLTPAVAPGQGTGQACSAHSQVCLPARSWQWSDGVCGAEEQVRAAPGNADQACPASVPAPSTGSGCVPRAAWAACTRARPCRPVPRRPSRPAPWRFGSARQRLSQIADFVKIM